MSSLNGRLVVELREDFANWLGESKYMYGLTDIPPSRFSNTNANGLWEYSPFLCGAGLSEALELSYGVAMLVWDNVPEPMCILHLHNMLVQKGLLKRPIGLWAIIASVFEDSFFNGKPPTSQFLEAFEARVGGPSTRRESFRNRTERKYLARYAADVNELLDPSVNRFFKTKYLLLADTKQIRDRVTGETTLEETYLVKRVRANGRGDKAMMELTLSIPSATPVPVPPELKKKMSFPAGSSTEGLSSSDGSAKGKLGLPMYLDLLNMDFASDICGRLRPLSSPNYPTILSHCYMLFMSFEE